MSNKNAPKFQELTDEQLDQATGGAGLLGGLLGDVTGVTKGLVPQTTVGTQLGVHADTLLGSVGVDLGVGAQVGSNS